MALNSTNFRDAIKPQDLFAVVITLMGLAIALFLEDSIIKLIGGSIAVLGGVALYVTITQRINDQIQLRTRRTTLPPPAFKTRVTHDPTTSTKRILFDDFQETFTPDDEGADDTSKNVKAAARPVEPSRPDSASATSSRPVERPAPGQRDETPVRTVTPTTARRSEPVDGASVENEFVGDGGESFRVIRPAAKGDSTQANERPSPAPEQPRATQQPVPPSPAPRESTQSRDRESAQSHEPDRRPDRRPVQQPVRQEPQPHRQSGSDGRAQAASEPVEPIHLSKPVEELEPRRMATRQQVGVILDDLLSESEDDGKGSEPRAEFVRLVAQTLNAIARSIQARSIVYFWVNLDRGHLLPEAKVSTGTHEIRTGVRFPLGTDVISQIARSGVPEIITDISPAAERELIAYYASPANTRSFVGVPVFFRREVVGVLAADSSEENAFDEGSVATLAEYTRLISGLIRGYTEKYDLQLTARTLEAFEQMHRLFTGASLDPTKIAEVLVEQIEQLFDASYIAAVLFDTDKHLWKVAACRSDELRGELRSMNLDMQGSLIGRATRFAEEVYIEQVRDEVRFRSGERLVRGGTFLALPLVAAAKCYGAVAIEHPSATAYIPRDVDILRDLVRYAAMAIEVFNTNQAIESQTVFDEVTGLYNSDFFLSNLEGEVRRARDFKTALSVALISIDFPSSLKLAGRVEMEELIVTEVGSVIGSSLRPYDVAGRVNGGFGVVLVGKNDQQAYLWAEKLRKEIASRIMNVGGRKFSVTVSIGLCDLGEYSTGEQLVTGARQALDKVRSGEGNAVVLF